MTDIRFDAANITTDGEGRMWLLLRVEADERPKARKFVYEQKNKRYVARLKEHKQKRSLDANSYCWVLLHELGKALRMDPVEIYRDLIPSVGDNYDVLAVPNKGVESFKKHWGANGEGWVVKEHGPCRNVKGCTTLFAYYGSSTYDTAQMSRLIDLVVQECRMQDIETLPPGKLALLKEEWHAS